jgi:D-lactate dehydrogenase
LADSVKIAFFETEDWERNYVQNSVLSEHNPKVYTDRLDEDTVDLAADAEIVSVFIYSDLHKPMLDRLPNLKMIATRSTGFDHIDIEECKRRGIAVENVPHYGENTVAEHAFGLILSLSRKIHKAVMRTSRLDFRLKGCAVLILKTRL